MSIVPPWIRIVLTVILGSAVIWYATDGLTTYTAEGQRRSDVELIPRTVPDIILIDQNFSPLKISEFKGKTVLMEFIYTSCPSFCYAMGSEYKQLQDKIINSGAKDIVLMSVSFDYENDNAEKIKAYADKFKAVEPYWYVVRAKDIAGLNQLIKTFEVIIVGNSNDGYEHDSAIHAINKNNKLYKIIDFNDDETINEIFD